MQDPRGGECAAEASEACLRLAVLEEHVHGLEKAHDARLTVLEEGLKQLSTKLDRVVSASWVQFGGLIIVILTAAIAYAAWTNQMLLQHITAGRP